MALPKKEKLKNHHIFNKLNSAKKVFSNKYFLLLGFTYNSIENKNEFPQIVFIIKKKLLKSAVKRNKVKRRIEEAYRINRKSLNIKNYKYLIFFLTAEILDLDFQELNKFILELNNYL